MPRLLSFTLVLVFAACASPTSAVEAPAPSEGAPDPTCAPGQRPVAGSASCTAVGTNAVPAGFVGEPWGFRPDAPQEPCSGATIALLGAKACEPIDDCAAPFPPANADVAVRKDGVSYPDRPALRVVSTLDAALATVNTGMTIAIDDGEFASPASFVRSIHYVGRCAERTAIRGGDFVANISVPVRIGFQSLSLIGGSKAALLVDKHATVALDRVYVHGLHNGLQVGNGASLSAKRTVFEGPPPSAPTNPNAATNALYAIYGGHLTLEAVEVRGFQNALEAESVGTEVTIAKSILHEQVALGADPVGLSQISAFLGAKVTIDASHVESTPGRIAGVGAERLDGTSDPTSPKTQPATLTVKNSTLVHAVVPRDTGSAIDVFSGATLDLENVSLHHESLTAIGGSDGATANVRSSVIQSAPSPRVPRSAWVGLKGSKLTVDSSAIVGSSQFAMVVDGASIATVDGSLITGNRELGIADVTLFMGAAQAIAISRDGQATIRDSAFVDNEGTAIFLREASAQLEATVLSRTHASGFGAFSTAITSIDSVVSVRASSITKNRVALAIRGGRALLRESAVTDHGDAIQIDGVTFVQTDQPLDGAADMQVLAARTTFARNTRLVTSKPLSDLR